MPKLVNTTENKIDTTLVGIVIPPMGSISVTNKTLERLNNVPYMTGQVIRGNVRVEYDGPSPEMETPDEFEPLTRTAINNMRREELIELISAHGHIPENTLTVPELQAMAKRIIFLDEGETEE